MLKCGYNESFSHAVLSFLELGVTPGVEQVFLHPEDAHVSEAIIPVGRFPLTGTDHDIFHVGELL